VTCTRFVAPERPTGAWREYYAAWPFALQPPDAPLWDVVPELGSTGPTVDATTFSKWGPALAERLGDATMVLCGVSTDCCVLSTAVAAADAGVAVRVVADACAGGLGREPPRHARGARPLRALGAGRVQRRRPMIAL
jgi:nicotinamidase-related amidase